MNDVSQALERLAEVDPTLAKEVGDIIKKHGPASRERMALLVEESLWGLSQEVSFGTALSKGYARLIGECPEKKILHHQPQNISSKLAILTIWMLKHETQTLWR